MNRCIKSIIGVSLLFLCLSFTLLDEGVAQIKKLIEAKKYKQAIALIEKQMVSNPQSPELHYYLGQCYLQMQNKTLAALNFEKALSLKGGADPEIHFALGETYQLSHNFTSAITHFQKANSTGKNLEIIKRIKQCEYGIEYLSAPKEVRIFNLGEKVNSPFPDYHPMITADQLSLYFTSRRPNTVSQGARSSDGLYTEDIYVTTYKSGWEKAKPLPPPINTRLDDACVGISHDGQTIFIYRGTNGGDIYIANYEQGKWSTPEPFIHNSPKNETSACLSPDGRRLFFVSNRLGTKDIFMCSRQPDGKWAKPIRLGGYINTPDDEESPYMDAEGKYLYFSSKGHSSMGGYDIFKVLMSTRDAVEPPENLGYPINSASDDLFFVISPDKKTAYYSSEKEGGMGMQDIYSIRLPPPAQAPALALFKGVVKNESGPVGNATITIMDNDNNELVMELKSNSETGAFTVPLPSGRNYGIKIEKKGFLFASENVYLSEKDGYKEIKKEIPLPELKPGVSVQLNNIFFDSGKSSLKKESTRELQDLLKLLRDNPTLVLEIGGHTDNTGDEAGNQKLSENRSQAVCDYLVVAGISAARLKSVGYGSSAPVADNRTEAGRQKNRRTEVKILSL
jgi:outer membrane protein OmpA-like peptidoglycan-associated protein